MNGPDRNEEFWDIFELSKKRGLAVQTLRNKVSQSEIPSVKVGRRRMFRPSEIDAWIAQGCPALADFQRPDIT